MVPKPAITLMLSASHAQSLDHAALKQLSSKCKLVTFKEGDIIMSQGQVRRLSCTCVRVCVIVKLIYCFGSLHDV